MRAFLFGMHRARCAAVLAASAYPGAAHVLPQHGDVHAGAVQALEAAARASPADQHVAEAVLLLIFEGGKAVTRKALTRVVTHIIQRDAVLGVFASVLGAHMAALREVCWGWL